MSDNRKKKVKTAAKLHIQLCRNKTEPRLCLSRKGKEEVSAFKCGELLVELKSYLHVNDLFIFIHLSVTQGRGGRGFSIDIGIIIQTGFLWIQETHIKDCFTLSTTTKAGLTHGIISLQLFC